MTMLKLEGVTKKGRERVKQFGEWWELDTRTVGPLGSQYVMVKTAQTFRWIWLSGDLNFKIVEERITDHAPNNC